MTELAKTAGKKKLGVLYCAESPICAQLNPLAKASATLSGLGYASGSISGTAPSYAAPCLTMKGAGVDALFVADNSAIVQRVTAGCAQQGYNPLTVSQMTTASNNWLTSPSFDGALLSSPNAAYTDGSIPAVKAFLDAVNKYAPGLTASPQFSFDTLSPWIAGKLFEAAAKKANIGPSSTSADVKKGLYALQNETLGGLMPPTSYTAGKVAFPTCYFTVEVQHGKFVSRNGGKATCLTPAQVTALTAAAHA
jgi:branched-chain amino acid transport system substrate-binding protein